MKKFLENYVTAGLLVIAVFCGCGTVSLFGQGAFAPYAIQQPLDNNAKVLIGGCLYTYTTGTTTPLATYSNQILTAANTNPIVLNSSGRAPAIFLSPVSYKFVLGQPSVFHTCPATPGTVLWSQDPVYDFGQQLKATIATIVGAGLVGFSQAGSYSAGTVGAKLQQFINVVDAPYNASTGSSDNSGAYATAIAALPANGGTLWFPCGDFKGKFTFPAYPKSVTVQGQGPCTILEEPSADSGIVKSSPVVVNFTSGENILRYVALKPHNSSTTSYAVDMRGQNRGKYEHIWFAPATNATGHFGVGFFCSTATALYEACYDNIVDYVSILDQVGPTRAVETQQFAAQDHFSNFHVTEATAMTEIFYLNSPNNSVSDSDLAGNALATAFYIGGGYNHVSNVYLENNKREYVGDGNGYQLLVDGGNVSTGTTSTVTCNSGQSGWKFTNVAGINSTADLVGCQNATVNVGSSLSGFAPRDLIGGLTTSVPTGAGGGCTLIEQTGVSGGLAAGTYTYNVTTSGSGGEGLPTTCGPITVALHSIIVGTFGTSGTSPAYHVYGRVCPTAATCKSMITLPSQGNDSGGLFTDDGSITPSGNSPTTTRSSIGDLNVQGGAGGDGATASYIYTSGGINYGTETGANNALIWTPQNGPAFTFQAVPFAPGFTICMYTSHSLQAGANTVSVLGNITPIKKGTDFSADLGTAIAANNMVCLIYNTIKNVFQYQGQ